MKQESKKLDYSVGFRLRYNRPLGKISFLGIGPESIHTKGKGFRYFILARNYKNTLYDSYRNQPLTKEELKKVISEWSTKGMYLVGDVFVIEIYEGEGRKNIIKKIKLDARAKYPAHAIGPTFVDSSYSIEF